MLWNLDQLKSELRSLGVVKSWSITREHVHRRERYFLQDQQSLGVDQDREARSESTFVRIAVNRADSSRQGEILKRLDPLRALRPQLEAAVQSALQTDHQAWSQPQPPAERLPELKTADPRMAEDLESVVEQVTRRIAAAVARKRSTRFNSAELFLSVHDSELHLANGLTHRQSQSRIYLEAAYSMAERAEDGTVRSDEFLATQWAVSLDDLDVEKLFDETSERAENSLRVSKPLTGHYPVIVDSEVLALVLAAQLPRLSGVAHYNQLPHVKPGEELVPGAEGDLLTFTLDPSLDYGADTTPVSEQGVPQKPLSLVQKNRVQAISADAQYSQYLGIEPTTVRGSLVVEPGTSSHQELSRSAPQVLEVLQFSSIFPDPNSGTFSSEIRLARLFDNVRGTVSWIKGGSISGSVSENFRKVRLSSNRVKRAHFSSDQANGQGYYGPEFALLNDVSVVG